MTPTSSLVGNVPARYYSNCPDYDLCEGCEVLSLFIHFEDHTFIKIKRPAINAGINSKGKRKPLLKRSIYSSPAMILVPHPK